MPEEKKAFDGNEGDEAIRGYRVPPPPPPDQGEEDAGYRPPPPLPQPQESEDPGSPPSQADE